MSGRNAHAAAGNPFIVGNIEQRFAVSLGDAGTGARDERELLERRLAGIEPRRRGILGFLQSVSAPHNGVRKVNRHIGNPLRYARAG